ncbi:MAG TPA: Fe-S-containing protein [Candidatus Polarisedimenticolia bacterium]|jgi:FTR1 family protein|nr:Fe-S-containing protein [Candidatus Polarisedimenticolia bacterium]
MLEALVVTLREGVEAALVAGIILIYLRKTGRAALERWVYLGLSAGVAASVACAFAFARMEIAEEVYEGWLMIAGAVLVTTMVIWMLRTAKGLKQQIEARVEAIASRSLGAAAQGDAAAQRGAVAAGLFGLTFVLILREGIETVLFLAAVNLTTDSLLTFFGGLLGIGLAILFGVAFVRGTARVDLQRFFTVTAIVLFVLAAQLLVGGLHEFGERGTIPIGAKEMELIGPVVKNNAILLASLLALPLIVLLVPGRAEKKRASEAAGLEGPERRLALAGMQRERLWKRTFAVAGIVAITALTVSHAFSRLPRGVDPPVLLEPDAAGIVRLPKAGFEDGRLHRYGVETDGAVVRFFVKKSGSRLVPVFDSCQVCGAHGYADLKGRLVCLACAADVNPATLGTGGGCNPIPLPFKDEGASLAIAVSDLKTQAAAFRAAQSTAAKPPAD